MIWLPTIIAAVILAVDLVSGLIVYRQVDRRIRDVEKRLGQVEDAPFR